MTYSIEDFNQLRPLKDRLVAAGIEAAVGAVDAPANTTMMSNFSNLYTYLSTEALSLDRIKSIFGANVDVGDKAGALSSSQRALIKHIDKRTFINSGSFLMHEIDGLDVPMLEFAEMLASFSEFPNRVIESLEQLNRFAAEAIDNRELLASMSTVNRLNGINCQLKMRAQFNAELKKMIKEVKVNSKGRPLAHAFSNVGQIETTLSIRNRISHEVKPAQTDRVVSLIRVMDDKLLVVSELVNDEETHLKPNAKVMTTLSKLLFEAAEMVQDLGIWYHYVNKFVVAMDKLVEDTKKI